MVPLLPQPEKIPELFVKHSIKRRLFYLTWQVTMVTFPVIPGHGALRICDEREAP